MSSRSYRTRDEAGTVNGGVSFWFRQIGLPEPRAAAARRPVRRRLHRRRRAHRAVDGLLPGEGPARPAHRRPREGVRRVRRLRPQRRLAVRGTRRQPRPVRRHHGPRRRPSGSLRAMEQTVDEVIARVPGGGHRRRHRQGRRPARRAHRAQLARLEELLTDRRSWGFGEDRECRLDPRGGARPGAGRGRARRRPQPARAPACTRRSWYAGSRTPSRRLGVTIYEGDGGHRDRARHGPSPRTGPSAPRTCCAAWRASPPSHGPAPGLAADELLDGRHRAAAALSVGRDRVGRRARLVGDGANAYSYAQRTADGRIAIGGRGHPLPVRLAHRQRRRDAAMDDRGAHRRPAQPVPRHRRRPLAHAWCGVLGVPRDWCASVTLDRADRARLGRRLRRQRAARPPTWRPARCADLVLDRDTDAVHLPWTNRRVRRWEPEPLRWLGVRSMYLLYREADRREAAGLRRPSRLTGFANLLTGR